MLNGTLGQRDSLRAKETETAGQVPAVSDELNAQQKEMANFSHREFRPNAELQRAELRGVRQHEVLETDLFRIGIAERREDLRQQPVEMLRADGIKIVLAV